MEGIFHQPYCFLTRGTLLYLTTAGNQVTNLPITLCWHLTLTHAQNPILLNPL